MRLTLSFSTCLLSLAAASPAGSLAREPKGHEWIPKLPGQSRSPCPGLNVMANHGYLPRSGKNIDLAAVRYGVANAYNYAPTTFDSAFQMAVDFNLTTTGNASTFNLADLAAHDKVEFDGSLSRNDHYFGDDNSFNPFIWATVAKRLGLYDIQRSQKDKYVTVEVAAKARAARVKDAKRVNPEFNASANEVTGSPGTTALYLVTLWDEKADAAPKSWIKSFFEQERIPYLEGYASSLGTQKTNLTIGAMFQRVSAVEV
ncbi:Cloroperoxidase [Coniochaeta ligniaria NRRL 30616]|uniref:Cloroperoxidase n=1 Tax=Coniochaeta ligniaria NRRL 30616 TaxID=1408157 RepID=A0A1J7IP16_9PEZI|nr:Cloroperoxidase [Coniochaeta ligniaria NRRL 30616]